MPEIGEIGRNKNYIKSVWMACPDCGMQHWVRLYKGKPQSVGRCRPCSTRVNMRLFPDRSRDNNPNWGGGVMVSSGYRWIITHQGDKFYAMATGKNRGNHNAHYIAEHRLVMAEHLGRCLNSWEIVHHINGDKLDNRIENLKLLPSAVEHLPSIKWQTEINKRDKIIAELQQRIKELENREVC